MAAEAVAAGTRGAPSRPRRAAGPPPVAFGGLVESGRPHPRVGEPSAPATAAPRSPTVTSGPGPGGRAEAPTRSYALPHRARPRRAGHAYGTPLAADVIRGMLTVPVVPRRRVGGVLHGAPRSTRPPDAGVTAARDVEQAPAAEDEAREPPAKAQPEPRTNGRDADPEQGNGALHDAPPPTRPLRARTPDTPATAAHDAEQTPVTEDETREPPAKAQPEPRTNGRDADRGQGYGAHAVVRAPVSRTAGREPRTEPLAGHGRPSAPTRAGGGPPTTPPQAERGPPTVPPQAEGEPTTTPPRAGSVTLARREPVVLCWGGVGAADAVVAGRPGTGPETVGSCSRPAMRRPGARTRGKAVSAARGAGASPEDGWETCPFIRRRFEFPSA
ncbi:hypothetical protein SUDANB178_01632 [Streptomyces sp. enrichment culture]